MKKLFIILMILTAGFIGNAFVNPEPELVGPTKCAYQFDNDSKLLMVSKVDGKFYLTVHNIDGAIITMKEISSLEALEICGK